MTSWPFHSPPSTIGRLTSPMLERDEHLVADLGIHTIP